MDEHPEPGLLPIIPRFQEQEGPSPLIPVIVLIIVGTLRWSLLQMVEVWNSFETEHYDWSPAIDSIQSHLTITALLIPVCLLLAVHAFGIPQVNAARNANPPSPFVNSITRTLWSSILLLVVIMALLLSIPVRSILHSPWQQQPDVLPLAPPMYTIPGNRFDRRSHVVNGICQDLGILQRRCENWKGISRDGVCQELAVLQKRCERSGFW